MHANFLSNGIQLKYLSHKPFKCICINQKDCAVLKILIHTCKNIVKRSINYYSFNAELCSYVSDCCSQGNAWIATKNRYSPEVLEGLVSTSKWARNEAKFFTSSRPWPRKTRIKSLVLKMVEKKAEIPRNSSSGPRKGWGKGKNFLPCLVLDHGKRSFLVCNTSSRRSSITDIKIRYYHTENIFLEFERVFRRCPIHFFVYQYTKQTQLWGIVDSSDL